jgi:hypothetical protein
VTPRLLVIPGRPGPGPARAAVGRAAAAGGLGDAAGGAGLARRPPRAGLLVRHRQHGDCASAIATAAKTGGRPLRGTSRRPSMPAWRKRRCHFRAVSTVISSWRAMAAFEWPALAARTIRARRLSRTVVFTRAARRVRVRPNNCGFAQGGVGLTGAARGEMSTGRRNGRAHEDERGHHRGMSGCRGRDQEWRGGCRPSRGGASTPHPVVLAGCVRAGFPASALSTCTTLLLQRFCSRLVRRRWVSHASVRVDGYPRSRDR